MSRKRTMARALSRRADSSIRFGELCSLWERLGFHSRIRGGHHIFWRDGIEELINLQTFDGNAKEAAALWIETANQDSRSIPEPNRRGLTIAK